MQYKTIVLGLLEQHPEIREPFLRNRTLMIHHVRDQLPLAHGAEHLQICE